MSLLSSLRSILVRIERNNNSIFTYPVDRQEKYLRHFKEPKDDIERSYYQYRCQMNFNKKFIVLGLNIVSLPLLVFYYLKKSDYVGEQKAEEAIFFADGKPNNIISDELYQEYDSWITIDHKKEALNKKDKLFFKELVKRYPLSWQFLLKCLIKIRFYSYAITLYNPKAIVVCSEYSFTSSVLTQYCEKLGIEHIDVMHGEKLFYIRDSFFRFHRCYVWGEGYIKLFNALRAEMSQFRVAIPGSIRFSSEQKVEKCVDYTYYLGAEEGEVLTNLMKSLDQLVDKGNVVMLRPHPRYSDINKIFSYKGKFGVEDCRKVSIEESVRHSRFAISGYSTVLNQAYHNGTGVVIDDVTQPEIYKKLVELKYVMLEAEHILLSDLIGAE